MAERRGGLTLLPRHWPGWLLVAAVVLAPAGRALAQASPAVVWSGKAQGPQWNDPLNWTGEKVPGKDADVVVAGPAGENRQMPILDSDATVASLRVSGTRVTIVSAALTVTKTLRIQSGATVELRSGGRVLANEVEIDPDATVSLDDASELRGVEAIKRFLADEASAAKAAEEKKKQTALSSQDTRLTIGLEQLGASSTDVSSHPLIGFMLTAPLTRTAHDGAAKQTDADNSAPPHDGPHVELVAKRARQHNQSEDSSTRDTRASDPADSGPTFPRLLAWVDVRLSGVTRAAPVGVTEIVGGVQNSVITSDSTQSVQGLSLDGGLEVRLGKGAPFEDGTYLFEPTLVLGLGAETPLDPHVPPTVFNMSAEARDHYHIEDRGCPDACAFKYLALVPPDRDRFLPHYDVGVRFKTHHFGCPGGKRDCTTAQRQELNFPGLMEIRFGEDAAITGGVPKGLVMKVNAFYPLPVEGLGRAIYVFGSMGLALAKARRHDPLLLTPPSATVAVPGPDVFVQTLSAEETNRDIWKIGIAFDLISLAKGFAKPPTDSGKK